MKTDSFRELYDFLVAWYSADYTPADGPPEGSISAHEEAIARKFGRVTNQDSISAVLRQGRAVLGWQEFPWAELVHASNLFKPEPDFREWLTWVLDTVEDEFIRRQAAQGTGSERSSG
ncbi:MAG TPA: hypothetical protein VEI97_00265 [bacterium]|nr:hypothetical protein [bacterium]